MKGKPMDKQRVLVFPAEPNGKPFVSYEEDAEQEGFEEDILCPLSHSGDPLADMICVQDVVGDPLTAVQICLDAGVGDLTNATSFLNEVIYRIKNFKYGLLERGENNAYLN